MQRTIYKYPLAGGEVTMPKNARILKVGMQGKCPYLWVLVDPAGELETRSFELIGTGHPIPYGAKYIDTFFDDPFVWHVFEVGLYGNL